MLRMSENYPERLNLPLSTEMRGAIVERAAREQISAVAFIRRCIDAELNKQPKIETLEKRIEKLEQTIRAAEQVTPYETRGDTGQKKRGGSRS